MAPRGETELLVLRHGKAGDSPRDHDRPLARRGEEESSRIGRWLRHHGLLPDLALASTARRASETARLALAELGDDAPPLERDPRLYLASARSIADLLGELAGESRRVLLVGHNPGLAELVEALTDAAIEPDPQSGTVFPTAALARLAIDVPWDELRLGCAQLVELVRGRGLRQDGPE